MKHKRIGMVLMVVGILLIIVPVVIFFIERHRVMQNIGIIGGADIPTFLYQMRFGGLYPVPVFVSAGSAVTMLGVLLYRQKTNK